jgi:Lar family restriction alleviation protein
MNQLRTCPFCGSDNLTTEEDGNNYYFVICKECLTTGPKYSFRDMAIIAWNRRDEEDD